MTMKNIKLEEIKIPLKFQKKNPSPLKLLEKAFNYINHGISEPLLVDQHDNLLDGYCTYLIYKSLCNMGYGGYKKVKVCVAEIKR